MLYEPIQNIPKCHSSAHRHRDWTCCYLEFQTYTGGPQGPQAPPLRCRFTGVPLNCKGTSSWIHVQSTSPNWNLYLLFVFNKNTQDFLDVDSLDQVRKSNLCKFCKFSHQSSDVAYKYIYIYTYIHTYIPTCMIMHASLHISMTRLVLDSSLCCRNHRCTEPPPEASRKLCVTRSTRTSRDGPVISPVKNEDLNMKFMEMEMLNIIT